MTPRKSPGPGERGSEGRVRLADMLRVAREGAGLTGSETARRAGVSASKISKLESGRLLPSEADVDTLSRVYELPAKDAELLRRLVLALRDEQSNRIVLTRGVVASRERWRHLERNSRLLRAYEPQMVLGLLQTVDYQRAIWAEPSASTIDPAERAATWAEQAIRHTHLGQASKTFVLVMAEGALRWHVGSPALMAGQLDHLAALATALPNVRVGILPWTTPLDFFPVGGFWLYDETAVVVATEVGTFVPDGSADVATYIDRFTEIEQTAEFGERARAHFERIAAEYRGLMAEPRPGR